MPSAAPGAPAPRPMDFFLRCWEYARDGRDVEASDVQDWGEEFGLLTKVSVAAPCGEGCWCEEYYGEFPVDCYRPVETAPVSRGSPTPAMIDAAAQALYDWQCSPYLGPFKKLRELDDYRGRLIDAEYMLRAALTAPEP